MHFFQGHLKLADFGLSKDGLLLKKDRLNKGYTNQEQKINGQFSPDYKRTKPYFQFGSLKAASSFNQVALNAISKKSLMLTKSIKQKRILGTPNYMSPEVIQGAQHSYPVDYWSLGVIAFQMIVGAYPFDGDTVEELFNSILNGQIQQFPDIDQDVWPKETDDFVRRLLDKNQKTRLGTNSIEQIKQHKFFEGIKWDDIRSMKPPIVPQIKDPKDFANSDPRREISNTSYNVLIKKIHDCNACRHNNVNVNGKGQSTFGSLMAIKEEEKSLKQNEQVQGWNSRNMNYLKKLNEREAKGKRQTYLKKHQENFGSIMNELNPSGNQSSGSDKAKNCKSTQQKKLFDSSITRQEN